MDDSNDNSLTNGLFVEDIYGIFCYFYIQITQIKYFNILKLLLLLLFEFFCKLNLNKIYFC